MKTFGSDPELLLTKNGKTQSAIGVVQGTADNRITIKEHQFYYDNVLAECAIKPGSTKKEVLDNFSECLQLYAEMIHPFKLTPRASEVFSDSQLVHEDARKAGCAPDWCAYELKLMEPPKHLIEKENLRSCGGHIHIGSDLMASDGPEPILMIYMLDLFVGLPSLYLDHDPTSQRRREIYGQAGRYRTKEYGIEYRSLGNFWLGSPQLTGLIFDLCKFAHSFVESNKAWDLWSFDYDLFFSSDKLSDAWMCKGYDAEKLREGINKGNKKLVVDHWELVKELLPSSLLNDVEQLAIRRDKEGDFYENWKLTPSR